MIGKRLSKVNVFLIRVDYLLCEIRDPKGFYKAAKEGKIPYFIGVSDPYEIPIDPDLELNGILPINQNVNLLLDLLKKHL
ncbi:MAG: adenylyl-sulfate kinase [Candidatus Rhabdochlamydia sp.]